MNDLFTTQDPAVHAAIRRKVANLYATSTLVKLESYVDECINLLLDRFSEIAREGREIDLQFWMQCYAFDVIGYITVRFFRRDDIPMLISLIVWRSFWVPR